MPGMCETCNINSIMNILQFSFIGSSFMVCLLARLLSCYQDFRYPKILICDAVIKELMKLTRLE